MVPSSGSLALPVGLGWPSGQKAAAMASQAFVGAAPDDGPMASQTPWTSDTASALLPTVTAHDDQAEPIHYACTSDEDDMDDI